MYNFQYVTLLRSSLEITGYTHSEYCLFQKYYNEEPTFLVVGLDNQITKLSWETSLDRSKIFKYIIRDIFK